MNKRLILAVILSILLVVHCIVMISLYLITLHEDISFVSFLAFLLIPVGIDVAVVCQLAQDKDKKNKDF